MKNHLKIFWIHSHITWIISKRIIEELNYKNTEILLLIYRDYSNNESRFKSMEKVDLQEIYLNCGFRQFYRTHENIRKFESYLKPYIQSRTFELFVPQTRIDCISVLIKNKNCISFNYIEEGTSSYNIQNYTNQSNFFNKALLFLFRLSKLINSYKQNYFLPDHKKLANCYCLSNLCFPEINDKVILSYNTDFIANNIEVILIFDALVSFDLMKLEDLIYLLKDKFLPVLRQNNYSNIHFKFHPEQHKNPIEITKIKEILNGEEQNYIELESSFIVENVIFGPKRIDLFCFISSLGIYATISENNVYSPTPYLLKNKIVSSSNNPSLTKKWIPLL